MCVNKSVNWSFFCHKSSFVFHVVCATSSQSLWHKQSVNLSELMHSKVLMKRVFCRQLKQSETSEELLEQHRCEIQEVKLKHRKPRCVHAML